MATAVPNKIWISNKGLNMDQFRKQALQWVVVIILCLFLYLLWLTDTWYCHGACF